MRLTGREEIAPRCKRDAPRPRHETLNAAVHCLRSGRGRRSVVFRPGAASGGLVREGGASAQFLYFLIKPFAKLIFFLNILKNMQKKKKEKEKHHEFVSPTAAPPPDVKPAGRTVPQRTGAN